MAPRRYLVTGGLGFLGSALARALTREGHDVRVFDSGWRGAEARLGEAARQVEVVSGDVRDAAAVRAAVKGVDAVCHFAFVNGTRYFYEMPATVLEVGVKGMLNVLDACLAEGVGELLLASSSEVYQTPPRVPTGEDVPLSVPDVRNPRYSYGGGKIISELLAIHYGGARLQRVLIVRPHNVYGPDMGWEHVIPEFVLRMRELCREQEGELTFPVQGTGRETRSFVYVEDWSAGLQCVLQRGEHLGIYNIGTTEEVSVEALAREVGRYFGRELKVVPGELREGSAPRRCPDITRLRALGFAPRVSLAEGVGLTARWYDDNAFRRPAS